jgi:hypothetical protein
VIGFLGRQEKYAASKVLRLSFTILAVKSAERDKIAEVCDATKVQ